MPIHTLLQQAVLPRKRATIQKKGLDEFDASATSFSESSDCLQYIVEPKDRGVTTNKVSSCSETNLALTDNNLTSSRSSGEANDLSLPVVTSQDESCSINEKRVRFSTLEIREYPMCIGENPAGSVGVPISIDWDHVDEIICSIDDYEEVHPSRRSASQMNLPSRQRSDILKSLGYSRREISEATKHAIKVRIDRQRTIDTLHLAPIEEFIERTTRAVLNATIRRGAKRREREYLSLSKRKPTKL
jgi:hypothetical protein